MADDADAAPRRTDFGALLDRFGSHVDASLEDLGNDYWNTALQTLQWHCINYEREVHEYVYSLSMLRRAAKLDESIKKAECQVDNFGRLDMKLYNAWNGLLAAPKPSQADLDTWPMDDVLIYNHPQWHLYVGSLVCPVRFDELRMYPDVVIAMNRDDPPRPCEPSDWYKHLEACGPFGTAHLRYGGWDQTHANDFDAEQRTHEFKKSWHRLVSDFRQLLTCWHRDDDSHGRQSADVQSDIKKGKGFNKGKSTKKKKKGSSAPGPCSPYSPSWSSHGKAIGKAYIPDNDPNGPVASSQGKAVNKGYLKNANPTVSAPARLGKATSKGHVKCSNGKGGFDARQSAAAARQSAAAARQSALASGLQMDEESFPGELAQALEVLEKKKAGPDVWNSWSERRRPLRVLVHCYGGVNRTCAAYSVLMMAFASMNMEKAIDKWIQHRAYYAPFKHREYMIEALLQMQEELQTYQLWKR